MGRKGFSVMVMADGVAADPQAPSAVDTLIVEAKANVADPLVTVDLDNYARNHQTDAFLPLLNAIVALTKTVDDHETRIAALEKRLA